MKLSDDARQAIHDWRWGPYIHDPIKRQEADDRVIRTIMDTFNKLEAENEALRKQGDYWCDLYKHKRAEHIATCLSKRWKIDALQGLLKRIRKHSTDGYYWSQEIDSLLTGEN